MEATTSPSTGLEGLSDPSYLSSDSHHFNKIIQDTEINKNKSNNGVVVEEHKDVIVHDNSGYSGLYTGRCLVSSNGLEGDQKKKLIPFGQGSIEYQNHPSIRNYSGTWKNGEWSGQGVTTLKNGDVYSGEHLQQQLEQEEQVSYGFHGFGTYTWKDQRKYVGTFEHDKRHGQGRYSWPDGAVYEGNFDSGIQEGYGKFTNESESYTGEWKGGKYHGHGVLKCKFTASIETLYRGNFVNGKPHGQGIEYNPDGTIRHDGQWEHGQPARNDSSDNGKNNKTNNNDKDITSAPKQTATSLVDDGDDPADFMIVENELVKDANGVQGIYRGIIHKTTKLPHGNGTMVVLGGDNQQQLDKNGNALEYYEGFFKMGQQHGKGRMCWKNGDSYEGDFFMGKRQGSGVYHWKDGKEYKGEFHDDLRHGKGTFAYDSRSSNMYEGEFFRGKRHGKGCFVFDDGSKYDGEWKDGVYNGQGILINADGKTYRGEFLNGLAHGHGKEIDTNDKVMYEGQWIEGQTAQAAERAAAVSAAKRRSDLLQEQHQQQSTAPTTSAPVLTTLSQLSLSSEKTTSSASSFIALQPSAPSALDSNDCEAVVNKLVRDSAGHLGQYTGIVLKSTEKPHGVGRIVYSDGRRIHEGFWVNGTKHGHGRCLFVGEGDFHEGEYVKHVRQGPGRYRWKDGRVFDGAYKDDLRHGKGSFTYPNGDKYVGMFERGDRNGYGRFDFKNGHYEGEWKNGRYDGPGKLLLEGRIYDGRFENGVFVEGRNYYANQPPGEQQQQQNQQQEEEQQQQQPQKDNASTNTNDTHTVPDEEKIPLSASFV